MTCTVDFSSNQVEFKSNDSEIVKIDVNLCDKKLRFGFFCFYNNNIVEITSVKNNLIKEIKYDQDDFMFVNTKLQDDVIKNSDDNNSWSHLTRQERRLDTGVWKFEVEIERLNVDKTGLVIGFINGESEDTSLDQVNRGWLAINGNGDTNMTKVDSYTLLEGQKIVCRIEACNQISFSIDNNVVLTSTNLNVLEPNLKNIKFAVLNYQPSNSVKINWIKTTNLIGTRNEVPDTPIFKNSKGEVLVHNQTFPDIGDEFGYIQCDWCEQYITSKSQLVSDPSIYW